MTGSDEAPDKDGGDVGVGEGRAANVTDVGLKGQCAVTVFGYCLRCFRWSSFCFRHAVSGGGGRWCGGGVSGELELGARTLEMNFKFADIAEAKT